MAKSLKEQNNLSIWIIVAVNSLVLYTILHTGAMRLDGFAGIFRQAQTLVPVGIASIIATVLNALPSTELKASLVYWRRKHALPGHRAFSVYASRDTRIDTRRLAKMFQEKLPSDPVGQNSAWYKMYKTVRNDIVVVQAHKTFLLLRDYTALSAFFLVGFGIWALVALNFDSVALTYLGLLAAQFLVVRQAAYNAGIRMVTNVLALKTA